MNKYEVATVDGLLRFPMEISLRCVFGSRIGRAFMILEERDPGNDRSPRNKPESGVGGGRF